MVRIEEIEAGDYVWAEDVTTGEKALKVTKVYVKEATELVHIRTEETLDEDQTIDTTANHPFYVEEKGWVAAENLEIGDKLHTEDGKVVVVESVTTEKLKKPVKVYNLEVEGLHTYYVSADEVLVHNVYETSYGKSSENYSGADNIADAARLKEYYKQAEKYGTGSIKELQNGRFRFYEELKLARTQGEMVGARHVREWDPYTGYKRDWYETSDYSGNIRQVRPDPNITGGIKVHYMFDADGNYTGNWAPNK